MTRCERCPALIRLVRGAHEASTMLLHLQGGLCEWGEVRVLDLRGGQSNS